MASTTRRHTLLAANLEDRAAAIAERDALLESDLWQVFYDPRAYCIGYECDQHGAYTVWLYEYVSIGDGPRVSSLASSP